MPTPEASIAEFAYTRDVALNAPGFARSPSRSPTSFAGSSCPVRAEMLNEVVARAVTAVAKTGPAGSSIATRRRGIRSQERLISLIEAGKASAAEAHWRTHMTVVGGVLLGQRARNLHGHSK